MSRHPGEAPVVLGHGHLLRPGRPRPAGPARAARGLPDRHRAVLPTLGPRKGRPKLGGPCCRLVRIGLKERSGEGRLLLLDARFRKPAR